MYYYDFDRNKQKMSHGHAIVHHDASHHTVSHHESTNLNLSHVDSNTVCGTIHSTTHIGNHLDVNTHTDLCLSSQGGSLHTVGPVHSTSDLSIHLYKNSGF